MVYVGTDKLFLAVTMSRSSVVHVKRFNLLSSLLYGDMESPCSMIEPYSNDLSVSNVIFLQLFLVKSVLKDWLLS